MEPSNEPIYPVKVKFNDEVTLTFIMAHKDKFFMDFDEFAEFYKKHTGKNLEYGKFCPWPSSAQMYFKSTLGHETEIKHQMRNLMLLDFPMTTPMTLMYLYAYKKKRVNYVEEMQATCKKLSEDLKPIFLDEIVSPLSTRQKRNDVKSLLETLENLCAMAMKYTQTEEFKSIHQKIGKCVNGINKQLENETINSNTNFSELLIRLRSLYHETYNESSTIAPLTQTCMSMFAYTQINFAWKMVCNTEGGVSEEEKKKVVTGFNEIMEKFTSELRTIYEVDAELFSNLFQDGKQKVTEMERDSSISMISEFVAYEDDEEVYIKKTNWKDKDTKIRCFQMLRAITFLRRNVTLNLIALYNDALIRALKLDCFSFGLFEISPGLLPVNANKKEMQNVMKRIKMSNSFYAIPVRQMTNMPEEQQTILNALNFVIAECVDQNPSVVANILGKTCIGDYETYLKSLDEVDEIAESLQNTLKIDEEKK